MCVYTCVCSKSLISTQYLFCFSGVLVWQTQCARPRICKEEHHCWPWELPAEGGTRVWGMGAGRVRETAFHSLCVSVMAMCQRRLQWGWGGGWTKSWGHLELAGYSSEFSGCALGIRPCLYHLVKSKEVKTLHLPAGGTVQRLSTLTVLPEHPVSNSSTQHGSSKLSVTSRSDTSTQTGTQSKHQCT